MISSKICIGDAFYNLQIVELPYVLNGKSYVTCKCVCNKIIPIRTDRIGGKNGSKSCGCESTAFKNKVGHRYGTLTVICRAPVPMTSIKKNRVFWECKCDCGKTRIVKTDLLNDASSCGYQPCGKFCPFTKNNINGPRLQSAKIIYKNTYSDGNLTFDDFLEFSQLNCFYCGIEPQQYYNKYKMNIKNKAIHYPSDFVQENGDFIYNGLDRLNSNLLHNIDNIVTCCWTCNSMKNTMQPTEFERHIIKIYNKLNLARRKY